MAIPPKSFDGPLSWTVENLHSRHRAQIRRARCGTATQEPARHEPSAGEGSKPIDSDQYNPSIQGVIDSTGPEARLMSGLAGHNLCFPFWGDPSEAEYKAA